LGGEVSLLALDGLWFLMREFKFDCPDFYDKLYAMLVPDLFHPKYRKRFFDKLGLFMTSSRLASYVVASFIKRLARLSLTAPPSGCAFVLPLILNLILRHPSCLCLIHRYAQSGNATEDVVFDSEDVLDDDNERKDAGSNDDGNKDDEPAGVNEESEEEEEDVDSETIQVLG